MKLAPLAQFFEKRLKQEMPGALAHNIMLPKLKNGTGIRFKNEGQARKGGVLILFYEEDGIVRFPLIERPEYDGIHSGQIALPGGGEEASDDNLIQTALREAEEEIGINKNDVQVLGSLSQFFVGASNYDILPVIGMVNQIPTFIPDRREVKEIITPAAKDLLDLEKRKTRDIDVRDGYILSSPYFDLQHKMVWGATAMMLSELVAILSEYDESLK